MADLIITPVNIADMVFKAAREEQLEVIKENDKRAERFQEPLPVPPWDVKKMIQNIKTFTPQFREHAKRFPYNGSSDPDKWTEIAITRLRDDYLIPISREDDDVLRQLCELWPELTPAPELTEQQRAELANLQKQVDAIMESASAFMADRVAELQKLADHESAIARGTQTPNDQRIGNLVKCLEKWQAVIAPDRYQKNFNRW